MLVELWEAVGSPEPDWQGKAKTPRVAPPPRWGVCALTGQAGPVWPLNKVSTTLAAYLDRLPHRDADPAGIGLGPAAAWAFRHIQAMWYPHARTTDGFVRLDPPALRVALARLATDPDMVVTVPVSMQRHLLAFVERGHVSTDRGVLPWGEREMTLLDTYARLRALGFGETALAEPAPHFTPLSRLDTTERRIAMDGWDQLAVWRAAPWYLDIAARATRTPKRKEP